MAFGSNLQLFKERSKISYDPDIYASFKRIRLKPNKVQEAEHIFVLVGIRLVYLLCTLPALLS